MESTAISAQGSTLEIADAVGSPTEYLEIANFKSWSGFDGSANIIDITHLGSDAEEIRPGIPRFGNISLDIDWNTDEDSHALILAQHLSRAKCRFRLTLPDGEVDSFQGYVMKVPSAGGVDKVVTGTLDIRITGAVARTPSP